MPGPTSLCQRVGSPRAARASGTELAVVSRLWRHLSTKRSAVSTRQIWASEVQAKAGPEMAASAFSHATMCNVMGSGYLVGTG